MTLRNLYSYTLIILCLLSTLASYSQSCGYSFSKSITIDHNKVSGSIPLSDFPVLISLTDNDLRTTGNGGDVINANGYDILFIDAGSGQQLAHQIERYNGATGNYVAWVKVPTVYPDFDTEITMIYGNNQVTTDPSTTAVWDDDYQAVWHLHNGFNDGTDLANDMTNSGSSSLAAKIANGRDFDGTNDHLFRTDASLNGNFPAKSSGSPNEFTLSGWINVDNLGVRQPLLSKQGDGVGNDRGFVFMMEDTDELKIELFKDNNSGTRTEVYSTTELTTNTWYYMVATYRFVTDGTSECSVYLNGVEEGSTNTALGPIFTNARDLEIGRYFFNGGANYWTNGTIDEVRVSDVVRSAGWIATEFENQNDPASFYNVGTEVAANVAPIVPVCNSGFKKVITIDNTEVAGGTAHTDFPVLISLTDNDLRTVANGGNVENTNGWDIVFTDDNLVPLDHQLESYDPTTGALIAWVNVPSLPTGVDYDIFMLYGNPNVFTNPSTPCTWVDYTSIWHLHDDFLDGSNNDHDGTNNGTVDNTTSQIADGQTFDGTDYIGVTTFPNITSDFTMSGWIRTTDNTQQGQRVFCDDVNNSGGYALSLGDGATGQLRFFARSMNGVILDGTTNAIANNTWYYVAGVADRTNQDRFIYINGVQDAADLTDDGTWGTDPGQAAIGGEPVGGETGNRFEGALDEIRISSVARSANWLLTEYNNQSNPSNFYSVGSEEALGVTSTQNGDWDQTTTWAGGAVPGDGANVTVQHLVDLDDRDVVLCNLTIETANNTEARLDLEGGRTVDVTENIYVKGNGTAAVDATLRTNVGNERIEVQGDLFLIHTDADDVFVNILNGGDSLIVNGNLVAGHTGGDDMELLLDNTTAGIRVEGNFSANLSAGSDDAFDIDINAGTFLVKGTVTLNRSGTFSDIHFDMDGGVFAMDSLFVSTADGTGNDQVDIDLDGVAEMFVNSNVYINMGGGDDHNLFINTNNGTSAEFNVGGDFYWDKNGGDDINITLNAANSEFNIGGSFSIISTGAEQLTMDLNDGTVSVTDSFIVHHFDGGQQFLIDVDGTGVLNTGYFIATLDNNANQELLIDIDDSGEINVTNDMILTMNDGNDLELHLGENSVGAVAQLTVGGDLLLDHNPSLGGDDIQFIISDVSNVTVDGVFTMDTDGASGAGNFYTQINDNSTMTVGSDIVMTGANGSGEIEIEMNGTSDLEIGGNFVRDAGTNNYGFLQSNSANTRITYNGTIAQIFADEDGAGTDGIEYEKVVINNTFGTEPQLTMEDDVTLTNEITFTDGVLQTTSTELLTIADDALTSGGNAGSYVSGPLHKVGNDPFIFLTGKAGIYARLELSSLTGAAVTDEFTAEYFRTANAESFYNPSQYAGNTGGMYNTSTKEYWELSRDNGSAQPMVSLYWEDNDSSVIDDTADLVVAHYIGAQTWVNEGGGVTGAVAAGKVTTSGNINTFSPFTFGSLTNSVNPLPVELLVFNATLKGKEVELTWSTASETNNDYFNIERSYDGRDFETIGTVAGQGTTSSQHDYVFVDKSPLKGVSFYRLTQVDYDGGSKRSPMRSVTLMGSNDWKLYPNPSKDLVFSTQPINGRITDVQGRQVMSLNGVSSFGVNQLDAGVYYVHNLGFEVVKLLIE